MRAQPHYLVARAARPSVSFQVLPFSLGVHSGMDGSFTVLAYGDPDRAARRKSSRSNHGVEGDCVEVAELPDRVAMRGSKDPTGPTLAFGCAEWRAFVIVTRCGSC